MLLYNYYRQKLAKNITIENGVLLEQDFELVGWGKSWKVKAATSEEKLVAAFY